MYPQFEEVRMSGIISIVPFKGSTDCKSRLKPVLPSKARAKLALIMLERVLTALSASSLISGRLLVGGDEVCWDLARKHGFQILPDQGVGLNQNMCRAIHFASRLGYDHALILSADLPFVNTSEVERVIDLLKQHDSVIVSSKEGTGTNALLIPLHSMFTPDFGRDSLQRHLTILNGLGVSVEVLRSSLLCLDLDTPEDWEKWRMHLLGKENFCSDRVF
jgi:2-phospho-L-lactate/phosphoenolpyruvate guanylyltransferase